ncbi:MAG: alpha/beta hydrolase [Verrucomicrobiota bacterium]
MPVFSTNPQPELSVFRPNSKRDRRCAVISFAGGGYGTRAEHEGEGYARHFADEGFHAFVCHYRVNRGEDEVLHPGPLEDGLWAIRWVREQGESIGFDSDSVGIIGSSAGGHLVAHLSTHWHEWGTEFRPAWAALCYPVIALYGPAAHFGSRAALIGADSSDHLAIQLSPQNRVTSACPPTFLWHTLEDQPVPIENSLLFAEALRRANVPFEIHISEKGRHGLGRDADFDWATRLLQWLEGTGRVPIP